MAKARCWTLSDAEARKPGEQTGLIDWSPILVTEWRKFGCIGEPLGVQLPLPRQSRRKSHLNKVLTR